jgi:hypothetical protein
MPRRGEGSGEFKAAQAAVAEAPQAPETHEQLIKRLQKMEVGARAKFLEDRIKQSHSSGTADRAVDAALRFGWITRERKKEIIATAVREAEKPKKKEAKKPEKKEKTVAEEKPKKPKEPSKPLSEHKYVKAVTGALSRMRNSPKKEVVVKVEGQTAEPAPQQMPKAEVIDVDFTAVEPEAPVLTPPAGPTPGAISPNEIPEGSVFMGGGVESRRAHAATRRSAVLDAEEPVPGSYAEAMGARMQAEAAKAALEIPTPPPPVEEKARPTAKPKAAHPAHRVRPRHPTLPQEFAVTNAAGAPEAKPAVAEAAPAGAPVEQPAPAPAYEDVDISLDGLEPTATAIAPAAAPETSPEEQQLQGLFEEVTGEDPDEEAERGADEVLGNINALVDQAVADANAESAAAQPDATVVTAAPVEALPNEEWDPHDFLPKGLKNSGRGPAPQEEKKLRGEQNADDLVVAEEVGEAAAPTAADAIVESRPDAGADYNDGIEPVTPDDLKPQKKAEIKNAETLLEDQKIALQKMVEAFNKLGWFGDKKKFKDFVAAQAFRIGTVGQGKETFLYASPKVPDSVNEEIVHYCLTLFKGNERKFKKFLGLLPDYADFSAPFTEVK